MVFLLPAPTRLVIFLSNQLVAYGWMLFVIGPVGTFFVRRYYATDECFNHQPTGKPRLHDRENCGDHSGGF